MCGIDRSYVLVTFAITIRPLALAAQAVHTLPTRTYVPCASLIECKHAVQHCYFVLVFN